MTRRSLGSIRPAGKGRWRVQVSAGYDPATQKRRRIDRTVSGTKREAEAELTRMLLEIGETDVSGVTLKHYLTQMYLPHMKPPKVRQITWDNYESKIRKHIVPYLGALALDEVTPLRLDRWLDQLQKKGVSKHTALHAYRILKAAMHQAVKWRLMAYNPLDAVEAPKPKQHELEVLTADEAKAVLAGVRDELIEPGVVLAICTGMRRSEICGLRWEDVDLVNGSVHVKRGRHQLASGIVEEPPKTPRSHRVISLPSQAIEPLKRHQQDTGYVVSDENGAPMPPMSLSRRYATVCKRLGVKVIPFRDLRHTHATLALSAGVDVVVVSRRLGHSTVTTTDSYYLRPGRAADELAAGLLDDLLAPTRAKATNSGVTRLKASGE